jgi:predicted NACHT family NTPase
VGRDAPGERCSIPAYLADMGSRLGFGFTAEAVEDQLKSRPSLLIVDGLDEIFDPVRRRDVVDEIVGLENSYPSVRVLVTSRIAGFDAGPFERASFAVATLDDLSPDQVEGFAEAWFGLVFPGDPGASERARDDLLDVVDRRPQLRSLAGNPLMLTIMATVARHKRLARSRTELYRQALDLLCYGWDYRKGLKLPNDSALADLDAGDTLKMLRRIAWRMQEGEGLRANAIQTADLRAELVAFFDADWRFDPSKARRAAAEMIDLLAERAWIVTPRGPALFGFVHRTFVEYLCAFELNERFRAQALSLAELRDRYVLPHVDDDSWHEVIRLLVGQLPAAAAGELVRALCPERSAAGAQGARLGLAWQCVAEVEPGNLREMAATCEALMDALYAWLAEDPSSYAAGEQAVVEALSAVTPGSWPVPCLVRRGLPSPSAKAQHLLKAVTVPLAGAIWRFEEGARDLLVEP